MHVGDTLDRNGGADLSATVMIICSGMKFPEPFLFYLSHPETPPPPLEMKGRVYASCVRSSIIYGSEAMLLPTNVGLKFQRA